MQKTLKNMMRVGIYLERLGLMTLKQKNGVLKMALRMLLNLYTR